MAKAEGKKKSATKAEIYQAVADETGFSKAEVKKFFSALENLVVKHLGKKGSRIITIPGVAKLTATPKAAVKGGKPVRNPFTGAMGVSKDKPATVKVRARALKAFIEKIR
jgi:nucleoid DNA-binding protein